MHLGWCVYAEFTEVFGEEEEEEEKMEGKQHNCSQSTFAYLQLVY
jgi:hypothetical protein